MHDATSIECLISLPEAMSRAFLSVDSRRAARWFAGCDPPGERIGSGAGTAHLLAQAWRGGGREVPFGEWLRRSRKLVIHGGGQSRRLPAYAPVGKPFIPIPVMR